MRWFVLQYFDKFFGNLVSSLICYVTTYQDRKTNSFVCFLEEVLAGKFAFYFYWPLALLSIVKILTVKKGPLKSIWADSLSSQLQVLYRLKDISTLDFSTLNFSTQDFSTMNGLGLKSLGLRCPSTSFDILSWAFIYTTCIYLC